MNPKESTTERENNMQTVLAAREENERQHAVIHDTKNHLLLLAPAGTGKTDTLARRIAHLIASGEAAPAEILTLTFTNRACREMRERAGLSAGARDTDIYTIHAFCAQMLRETPVEYTNLLEGFSICDEQDAQQLVQQICLEAFGRAPDAGSAQNVQRYIALQQESLLNGDARDFRTAHAYLFTDKRRAVENLCRTPERTYDPEFFAFLKKYGVSLITHYTNKLLENNLCDFNGLLLRARQLLHTPETLALWESRYAYIHVDEAQDLSMAEFELLKLLCKRAVTLFCGDFNQTIYQWRGSDPERFYEALNARFAPQVIHLNKNYRSSPALLSTAQNFLYNALGQGEGGESDPFSEPSDALMYASFDQPEEEAAWISRQLDAIPPEDYSRTAVITRTNNACAQIVTLLADYRKKAGASTPFMLADEFRLFKKPAVKDLLACLSLVCNPPDDENFRRALPLFSAAPPESVLTQVSATLKKAGGARLSDFAHPHVYAFPDHFTPLRRAMRAGDVVVFDVESTGTDVYRDEVIQLAAIRMTPAGDVKERFLSFLRPSRPVGTSVMVHGFTDEFLLENGIDAKEGLCAFLAFARGCLIIGHNVQFDIRITNENLRRLGVPEAFQPLYYDTLDLSRRFLPRLPNHKLGTVNDALGCTHAPTHDAMDDILATAQVLWAISARYLEPAREAREAFYREYAPYFSEAFSQLEALRAAARPLDVYELTRKLLLELQITGAFSPADQKDLDAFEAFTAEFAQEDAPLSRQVCGLLDFTALSSSELDRLSKSQNKIAVITAHQAKGCEFDYVFLPMLQDGLFPSFQSIQSGDITEEKRVFYVCLTRAKKRLYLTYARHNQRGYPAQGSCLLSMLRKRRASLPK